MLSRLFGRKPAAPQALRGAPAVRRQKTYSAQTGRVYQYYYEGYRETGRGRVYTFQVSSDRKSSFVLSVLLPQSALDAWRQSGGRDLAPTEQYAVVKMTLFETFDERGDLDAAHAEAELDSAAIERHLATLQIDK